MGTPLMLTRLLILAIQMFVLTFGCRFAGLNATQTLLLSLSIVTAIIVALPGENDHER